MNDFKCYMGGAKEYSTYPFVCVCFAENINQAKKMMWECGNLQDECDGLFINVRAKRMALYDHLVDINKNQPYLVTDNKTLREMLWCIDGDDTCDTCGKASMNDEFPVCQGCNQCEECGCDCKPADAQEVVKYTDVKVPND